MADLFGQADTLERPRPGDLRRGRIVSSSSDGLIVQISSALQGFVPAEDLKKLPPEERDTVGTGQDVLVYVTGTQHDQGKIHLSLYLARKERDWLRAKELLEEEALWEGEVASYNKGGLVVPFGHIRGFVPASQVTGVRREFSKEKKLAHLANMVGQQISLRVIEVDRRRRRLILSERLGRQDKREHTRQQALAHLRKGEIRRGKVRALTDYGAFVDLGGVVGLVHRSELAWFRVDHPREIVQKGQEVEVYVLRVSKSRGRVSLSIKRTYPDPWPVMLEQCELNQLVEGRIIRHTDAGLFVQLDQGGLGFIPDREVGQGNRNEEEIKVGRRILSRVILIDGVRRRLGLSLRRVRARERANWQKEQEQPSGHRSSRAGDTPKQA